METNVVINKVLFIEVRNGEKPKFSFDEIMEPIGLCYVAAVVKQAGYEVKIIQQVNVTDDALLNEVIRFSPDVVGFTAVTANYNRTVKVAKLIKKNMNVITIIGGVHATTNMEDTAKDFDYVIVGEGEESTLELLRAIDSGNTDKVEGIAFIDKSGKCSFTGYRERIQDLDALPFPLRDDLEMKFFTFIPPYPSDITNFATLSSTRACRFKCKYCANESMWRGDSKNLIPITTRSVQSVADEMEFLKDKYNVNYVWFHDPNFTHREDNRIENLCKELQKRNLDIKWSFMGRVDDILQDHKLDSETVKQAEDLLDMLHSAGCHMMSYGVESGSKNILKCMKRGIDIDETRIAIELTFNAGIIPVVFFVIGVPEETKESLNSTREYAFRIKAIRYRFAYFYPFIGTKYRDEVDNKNLWLSEEHKNFDLATTEVQTVKCGVDPSYLKNYIDNIEKEIYKNKIYEDKLEEFISRHPDQRDTILQWKADLSLV